MVRIIARSNRVVIALAGVFLAAIAVLSTGVAERNSSAPASEQVTSLSLSGPFTLDEFRRPQPAVLPAPSTEPALPTPVMPPADPYAPEAVSVIGTIEIPALGLAAPLHQGVTLNAIDRGPSHWPGTARPGELGNVVVAGHRVTRGGPFRHIDKLVPGDQVIFTVDGRRSVYRVTGHEVVTPDAMRIVDQTPAYTGTLFACHPPGSEAYRYVVRLALEG
ncbi:MAG: class E sortase [Actinobacteria bacterium]|nr:class E sortase [Actinomycetota bacterium]